MNRKALIQDFFKSINSMARIGIMQHKHDYQSKNLPSHSQMGVLFVVSHHGPITIKELSQFFGMTSSAATQLVNELVRNNYLARKEDSIDRRKIKLILTAKAKKSMADIKKYRIKKIIKMFEPLTDKELSQLLKIQEKIVEHWETINKNK